MHALVNNSSIRDAVPVPTDAGISSAAVLPRVNRSEPSTFDASASARLELDSHRSVFASELGLQSKPKVSLFQVELWFGFSLWCMGAAGIVMLLAHRALQTARILRRSTHCVPPHLLTMTYQTARRLGIRKPSRVELSNEVSVPMLVLSGNVQLILPADFEAKFGLEGCRMAIAHELAHHKRRDLWWNLLPTTVSVVLFFWPPAWLAARRYYLAMELACDECAIRSAKLGHAAYAGLLVRLLEDQGRRRLPAHALSMAWSGSFRALSERIRFMKIDLQNHRYRTPISTLVMIATIGLLVLPWAVAHGQDGKKSGASKKSNRSGASRTGGSSDHYDATPPANQPPANVVSGFSSGSAFGFGNASSGGNGTANSAGNNGSSMAFGSGGGMAGGGGSVSGGVSIGLRGNPPADLESPGAQSSNSGRSTGSTSMSFGVDNNAVPFSTQKPLVSRSREMSNGLLVSKTQVHDGKFDVLIEESSDKGYVITIREQLKTRSKMRRVQAKNIDELEQKYPVAYEWVRKYHLAGVTLDQDSEEGDNGPGPKIDMTRRESTTSTSHSFSGGSGISIGSSSAGGTGGFGGFSSAGGATGNEAMEIMEKHLEQQIQQADLSIIADVASQHGLMVIADEIYESVTWGGRRHTPIASLSGMQSRTIGLMGMTKSYAMGGWRIGYDYAPAPIADRMTMIQGHMSTSASSISQAAAKRALGADISKRFAQTLWREWEDRCATFTGALAKTPSLRVEMPEGGYYAWIDVSQTGLKSNEFANGLLHEEKVVVVPGAAFGTSSDAYVRATCVKSRDEIASAVVRIRSYVERVTTTSQHQGALH
ncbi:MAG: aminotransferase class I/II-fold pyridoxal phosphate-dependent enzyme [Planctomycetes bacterium]|nr:aminotransferase class I/II-fold pyridoxal phosphate-dependent enzyme [Planctomycetota bacterium]